MAPRVHFQCGYISMKSLYLGSTSASRKSLLAAADIPFICLPLDVDEKKCDWTLPLPQLVSTIAAYKMLHVQLPGGHESQEIYVLTADTLSQDARGTITGKPTSHDDAREMIRAARNGMITSTAFCLEKKRYTQGHWHTVDCAAQAVQAQYHFEVPEPWLEWYLTHSRGLECSGAIAIEDHGGLFLRDVQGSYTTIAGLPLFELRQALEVMGFFNP